MNGGCFLNEDIRDFDPTFFGIHPNDAKVMDPSQRKALEVAYECFESAGLSLQDLNGSKTGCFVANFTNDHTLVEMRDAEYSTIKPYFMTGIGNTILSNRVSYVFNLRGPR